MNDLKNIFDKLSKEELIASLMERRVDKDKILKLSQEELRIMLVQLVLEDVMCAEKDWS